MTMNLVEFLDDVKGYICWKQDLDTMEVEELLEDKEFSASEVGKDVISSLQKDIETAKSLVKSIDIIQEMEEGNNGKGYN